MENHLGHLLLQGLVITVLHWLADETTGRGFVFKDCHVCESGPILLGRAYRTYWDVYGKHYSKKW